ncbi:SDR family oxidoreductase [Streptomyces lydicus]|uniref:SDR family oxidoreductase n=1 Tax=Streptomyces lydicus TaxID=47763 RepID=UPI0034240E16
MTYVSALVLGGGGGIGAAVSRRLAADHAVAVGCRHGVERARRLAEDLVARGGVAEVVQSDATTEEGVVAAFDAAERLGSLRVVVHCVGGWDYPRITELTEKSIDEAIALNLRSALLVLRESARRVTDGGRVVLLSSAAAQLAPARQSTYAAAKAGVEAAARVAAKEVAARGIAVNVVRPGATDTERLREGTSPRAIEAMAGANAMRRLGTPDDIAGAVLMLCGEDSRWITGVVVDATGGLT